MDKKKHETRNYLIALIPALIYWGISTGMLLIVIGNFTAFPEWLERIFGPGYYLGFLFGYAGGDGYLVLGQLISLAGIYVVSLVFVSMIRDWKRK